MLCIQDGGEGNNRQKRSCTLVQNDRVPLLAGIVEGRSRVRRLLAASPSSFTGALVASELRAGRVVAAILSSWSLLWFWRSLSRLTLAMWLVLGSRWLAL